MITNVHRAKASGDIQRYIRYTIAPEKDQKNENYKHGERTLAIEADNVFIGSNVERNKTSKELEDQFIKWNEEHRTGKKPPKSPAVLGVISFTEQDAKKFYSTTENGTEYLDHQKIIAVAREAVSETMGGNRPMYFALHGDKDHLHVHFAASMVDSQGKIYDGSKMINEDGKTVSVRDFRKWEMTNEALEQKYGLDRVQHRKAFEHQGEHRKSQVARPSNAVVHLANKNELAPSMDLAGRLDWVHKNCNKQFDQFLELAEQSGIRIKPNMGSTKVNGLAFACGDMDGFIKASDLGNKYKWTKLEKDLHYEHNRDYQKLAELKDRTSTNRPAIETNINAIGEVERLSRNTEELTQTIRHEQSTNEPDNGISSSIGYESRVQHEPVSRIPNESTENRTFDRSTTTNDTTGAAEHGCITTGDNSVCDSPSPMRNNGVRNVEPEQQDKQPAATSGTDADENIRTEQDNLRASEEDKVRRRERSIQTLMRNGGYSREQAESFYNTEQKLAESKDQEPVWTPDTPKSVPKANLEQVADSFNANLKPEQSPTYWGDKMRNAFAEQERRSRSSGYSSDSGLSR